MSVMEIKAELGRLTPTELSEVESHLRLIRWKGEAGLPDRLSAAHARIDEGKLVTQEQLLERIRSERPDALTE